MNHEWNNPATEESQLRLMGAATAILRTKEPGICPLCDLCLVRFYCHKFHFESNRGTMWIWCPACKLWTHVSRLKLQYDFLDPFENISGSAFASMERSDWINRLDQLWE